MKVYKDLVQQSDEWLEVKLGKLSSSDAHTISYNGSGLETLCYKKVAERISGKMDNSYTNSDMERGNEQEDNARASYEMETGNLVEQVGFVELNENVGCSPDGLVGKDGLVEIKSHRDYKFTKLMHTKKIEPEYISQMQMQMLVTDRKWCDYVAFNENFPNTVTIRVDRDESKIEKIRVGLESGIKKINKIMEDINGKQ